MGTWGGQVSRWYSRWDLNPNLRLRRPTFYPLNYGSGNAGENRAKGDRKAGWEG